MPPTVLAPSNNKLNRGFSSSHPAYDHDDAPDNRVFASFDGEVTMVVDRFTTSWIANTPSDPWYPGQGKTRALKTEDYGNLVKIAGDTLIQFSTHLKKGAIVSVGQRVKKGQLIGYAGDNSTDTGNSTGGHTHNEYRYKNNVKTTVEFSKGESTMPATSDLKKILDYYKVKDSDELMRMVDEQLKFLKDEREKTSKLEEAAKTHNASLGQYKSQADKYKIVKDVILSATGIEVKTAEDVANAFEKYAVKYHNDLIKSQEAEKKEAATGDASKELVKETGRIVLLAAYATPISAVIVPVINNIGKKYDLPEVSLVEAIPVVTAVLRVIDRTIYQLGKSLQNESLAKSLTRF
jgi:transketolase